MTAVVDRERLAAAARSYLAAVDRLGLDGVLAGFAPDATLTVQTAHATFAGAEAIGWIDGETPRSA